MGWAEREGEKKAFSFFSEMKSNSFNLNSSPRI
jgi:hypothetical protein